MVDLREPVSSAVDRTRVFVNEVSAKELLSQAGIEVPKGVFVARGASLPPGIVTLRPPLALKVVSRDIVHKSDVGGVVLNVQSHEELSARIDAMTARPGIASRKIDGVLVEEMAPPGEEVVVGAVRDHQFGYMLMVGLGGIFVELLADVAFRVCPIDEDDARGMLAELRGAPILDGTRGRAGLARDEIVKILMRMGSKDGLLMRSGGDIVEMDLNPIIVSRNSAVAVDARIITDGGNGRARQGAKTGKAGRPRDDLPPLERFKPLLQPCSIAVLGASSQQTRIANSFIRRLKEFGYEGRIYPVHPTASEIEGLKCYPSIAQTPEAIDYAYVAIGSDRVFDALSGCREHLNFAQIISSGFGEVEEGKQLQEDLVAAAHAQGVRILGPNCLGLHSPKGGVTFPKGTLRKQGSVGVVSQSGGLGTDIIKRGQFRGLNFSALVTVGNSSDVGPIDLIEYFLEDPGTAVVGLYLENIGDGRRLYDLLRGRKSVKPVVVLRGGRSWRGRTAAESHTGAIAGDGRAWQALGRQTPLVEVGTLDEFIDALLVLQSGIPARPRATKRVILFGNGGGTSVLATDFLCECGFDVPPVSDETRARLEALDLPPGNSIVNPIDTPVATLQRDNGGIAGRILDIINEHESADAVIIHLNLASFLGRSDVDPVANLIGSLLCSIKNSGDNRHFAIVLRTDGSAELDDQKRAYRRQIIEAGIPVFDEIPAAAKALAVRRDLEAYFAAG